MQDTKAQRQMGYYGGRETLNNGYKRCTEPRKLDLTVLTVQQVASETAMIISSVHKG